MTERVKGKAVEESVFVIRAIDGRELYRAKAGSLRTVVQMAVMSGVDLRGADLHGVDLSGTDLSGTDLRGVYLRGADLCGTDLREVNLRDVDLSGTDLREADMHGADMRGVILPNGIRWEEYLSDAVPALLTAGGKTLTEVLATGCWDCHDWGNCPMHAAFGIIRPEEGPILLRNQIVLFVQLFDSGLIPKPELVVDQG